VAKLDTLVSEARRHFDKGEELLAVVQGVYEIQLMGSATVRTGIFIATDRRLIFYAKR
jgi:hypothetical protein